MATTQLHPQLVTGRRYGSFAGRTPGLLTTAGIAAAVWNTLFDGYRAGDLLKIIAAVAAGKTTIIDLGNHQATVTFRAIDDSHDTVVADMDGSERLDVTLDP